MASRGAVADSLHRLPRSNANHLLAPTDERELACAVAEWHC